MPRPLGADAEWVLSLDIEEIRGLVEHRGDFGIVHRHRASPDRAGVRSRPAGIFIARHNRDFLMQITESERQTSEHLGCFSTPTETGLTAWR